MSYFIYLRKSRKDHELELELGDTLARHRKQLLELARNRHLTISAIYEEVVSGETIAQRPEMQRMLCDIEQGGCDGVLVMEVERLARGDTVDQGIISRTFSITGTKIITPLKTYDPNNEFDQEYFEFGLFMSRREYKTIHRRIQAGRIASVKDGKYIGSVPPYGYSRIKIPDGKGYTLEPKHPESDVVRTIFDLYIHGRNGESYGSYKIAAYLEDHGYKTATGAAWSASSVRDILKNKTYAGYILWGRDKEIRQVSDGSVFKKLVRSDDFYCVKGLHDAIIPEDWFDAARKKMSKNQLAGVPQGKVLKNPLAGLVYCAKCGRLMTRLGQHPKNRYETLHCPTRNCSNIASPISLIEDELLVHLDKWVQNRTVPAHHKDELVHRTAALESQISALEKEIDGYHDQLEKAYTFLEKEIYTEDVFLARSKKLNQSILAGEASLDRAKKELSQICENIDSMDTFIPHAIDILGSYKSTRTALEKNHILKELVEKVVYLKEAPNKKGHALEKKFSLEIYPRIH